MCGYKLADKLSLLLNVSAQMSCCFMLKFRAVRFSCSSGYAVIEDMPGEADGSICFIPICIIMEIFLHSLTGSEETGILQEKIGRAEKIC